MRPVWHRQVQARLHFVYGQRQRGELNTAFSVQHTHSIPLEGVALARHMRHGWPHSSFSYILFPASFAALVISDYGPKLYPTMAMRRGPCTVRSQV